MLGPWVTRAQAPTSEPSIGLSLLFLNSPQFPWRKASAILQSSPRPILATLADWKGKKVDNLGKIARDFQAHGATPPEVSLYILCGPCRSPRRDGSLLSFHPELSIRALNRQWFKRPKLQKGFTKLATRTIGELKGLGSPRINLIPELEDSLKGRVYNSMVSILEDIMAHHPQQPYTIVRNPLHLKASSQLKEAHGLSTHQFNLLKPGDFTCADGDVFRWQGERVGPKEYSYKYTQAFIKEALSRGVGVLIWHPEWQDPGARPIGARRFKFTQTNQLKFLLKDS